MVDTAVGSLVDGLPVLLTHVWFTHPDIEIPRTYLRIISHTAGIPQQYLSQSCMFIRVALLLDVLAFTLSLSMHIIGVDNFLPSIQGPNMTDKVLVFYKCKTFQLSVCLDVLSFSGAIQLVPAYNLGTNPIYDR